MDSTWLASQRKGKTTLHTHTIPFFLSSLPTPLELKIEISKRKGE